jgi:AP-1 complex subunit beta-1
VFFGRQLLIVSREQAENARENPLAAAAAAAAVAGQKPLAQGNIENLLDIDFDGAAPASAQKSPAAGMSGLEGLAGTPQRVASPAANNSGAATAPRHNLDDLMGLGDMSGTGGTRGFAQSSNEDILSGFASLDMTASTQPPPPAQQLSMGQASNSNASKSNDDDLLGLF